MAPPETSIKFSVQPIQDVEPDTSKKKIVPGLVAENRGTPPLRSGSRWELAQPTRSFWIALVQNLREHVWTAPLWHSTRTWVIHCRPNRGRKAVP